MDCGEPCLWRVGAAGGQLEGLGPKVGGWGAEVARLPLSAGGGSIISWSLPFPKVYANLPDGQSAQLIPCWAAPTAPWQHQGTDA